MRVRQWARVSGVVFAFAMVGRSCGPSFPEAVFVRENGPAVPYAAYVAGQLGVVQPTYPIPTLAIAYQLLSGQALSASEQAQATSLAGRTGTAPEETQSAGLREWLRLRQAIALPGGYTPADPTTKTEATIDVERQAPGQSYESFTNCLDDAFHTAAATLQARQREHGAGSAEVLDWVRGQDAVFSNCAGPRPVYPWQPKQPPVPPELAPDRTPTPLPASASLWLRQDKAYQTAAAAFYRTDYDAALAAFKAISADAASPWQKTARYLVARTMLRHATLGQRNDVPPQQPNGPTYQQQEQWQKALEAKLPERFEQARAVLVAIRDDAGMGSWHAPAAKLIDLIDARLDPAKQAGVLAARLSAKPSSGNFGQTLVDLTYTIHHAEDTDGNAGEATQKTRISSGNDLVTWLEAMRSYQRDTDSDQPGQIKPTPDAAATALAGWRRTHTVPWLVAALTYANPGGPGESDLITAAKKVSAGSPGWLSVTYHRLRLTPETSSRTEVEAVLARVMAAQPVDRSATNLLEALLSRTSPTLDSFLRAGVRVPATTATDGIEDDPSEAAKPEDQVCGPQLAESERPLFAGDTATVLNQRMPVRLLAEAALSPVLPPHLKFQVAQSAWTRAVLLDKPEIANAMAPLLIGCHDAWRPLLDAYAAATTPEARHVAGLFALMRFASTEPMVREGEPRPEGFATYSQYRDNWWCGNAPYEGSDGSATDPKLANRIFATPLAPKTEVPDPPFLTAAEQSEAATEIAALQKIPGASDYFAREALAWYQEHPSDPRNADLLGQSERVVRNSCRSNATKELNHRLFVVMQTKYPGSEWAKKYKTWE